MSNAFNVRYLTLQFNILATNVHFAVYKLNNAISLRPFSHYNSRYYIMLLQTPQHNCNVLENTTLDSFIFPNWYIKFKHPHP